MWLERFAHHIWGFMVALVALVSPALSVLMFTGFIIYELDEEWHIKDKSYADIREMLIGMGIGAALDLVIKILLTPL